MALTERLEVILDASARGLIAGLREGEGAAKKLDTSTSGAKGKLDQLGLSGEKLGGVLKGAVVVGAAGAGAAIAKFALDGVDKFASLTNQIDDLQRIMGGTAEDASKMAAAFRGAGLDSATAERAFGQLAKRIGEGKDTLANYGVEIVRAKDGSVDMSATLLNVGDRFKAIKDPAERAAFLTENFGKAGQQVGELLERSRSQVQGFFDAATKHGEVFSAADLESGRQYRVAIEELHQAFEGLQVTLGKELAPILTDFARGLTTISEVFIDVEGEVVSFVKDALGPLGDGLGFVAEKLGLVGGAAKTVGHDFGDLATKLEKISASNAVETFRSLAKEAKEPGISKVNNDLTTFAAIAAKNPGAAQLIINGLKEQGVHTAAYDRALQVILRRKASDVQASSEQEIANKGLAESYKDPIEAAVDFAAALDKQKKAQDAVENSLLGLPGAAANFAQALDDQAAAQKAVNDAQAAGDPEALAQANRDLEKSNNDVAQAALALDQAQTTLNQNLQDPKAVQDAIDHLNRVEQAYPQARDALEPYRQKLQDTLDLYNFLASVNDISKTFNLNVTINDQPVDLAALGGASLASIGFRAGGGSVKPGGAYFVGESGPELFMPSTSGTIIPNAQLSQSAGSAGITINQTIVDPIADPYTYQLELSRQLRNATWLAGR